MNEVYSQGMFVVNSRLLLREVHVEAELRKEIVVAILFLSQIVLL